MAKVLQVKASAAIKLLLELGYKTAEGMKPERLKETLEELPHTTDDAAEVDTDESGALMDDINEIVADGGVVEIIDDTPELPKKKAAAAAKESTVTTATKKAPKAAPPAKEKPAGKPPKDMPAKKKAKAKAAEAEAEDEDEEAEDKPVPVKAKKAAKAATEKRVGVIASIAEFVLAASKKKPITKDAILEKLAARFPEKEKASMTTTIATQLGSKLAKEKGIKINKNADGAYWGEQAAK